MSKCNVNVNLWVKFKNLYTITLQCNRYTIVLIWDPSGFVKVYTCDVVKHVVMLFLKMNHRKIIDWKELYFKLLQRLIHFVGFFQEKEVAIKHLPQKIAKIYSISLSPYLLSEKLVQKRNQNTWIELNSNTFNIIHRQTAGSDN